MPYVGFRDEHGVHYMSLLLGIQGWHAVVSNVVGKELVYAVTHRFKFAGVGNDLAHIMEQEWAQPHTRVSMLSISCLAWCTLTIQICHILNA